jgi:hypothetical protein
VIGDLQRRVPVTRREIGSGLAFAEEDDLLRLSTWAAEGWRLSRIDGMWLVLEQAPPEQVVFAIDYQDAPDSEYYEMCGAAGWYHVASIKEQIHVFKALPGTAAIFSPTDMTAKYQRAARMFALPALWSSIGLGASVLLLLVVMEPWLSARAQIWWVVVAEFVLLAVVLVLATMSIFTLLPWVAYRLRLAGVNVRMNRWVFGVLFGICGAVVGYFIGSMIP